MMENSNKIKKFYRMNMMVNSNKMVKFKTNKIFKMNMMQKCKIQNLEAITMEKKRSNYWVKT